MIKRVVAITTLVVVLTTLFIFPVFADTTTTPQYIARKYQAYTYGNLSVYYRATEFNPVIGEQIANVSGSPGIVVHDAYVPVLVTIKFVNSGSSNIVVDPMYLDLKFTYATNFPNGYGIPQGIREIINYSDEAYITYNYTNNTSMSIVPSVDWSINGAICVPAGSTLVAMAEVRMNAYHIFSSSGYETRYPTLDSIANYGTPTTMGTNDVPNGLKGGGGSSVNYTSKLNEIVDLLDSIDDSNADIYASVDGVETMLSNISGYVDGIEGYIDNLESYLDGVEGLLGNIKTLLTWTGNFPTVTYSSRSYSTYEGQISSNANLTYHVEMVYGGGYPVLDSTDFETPNTLYQNILYKHRVVAYIRINNNTGNDYTHTGNLTLYRFISSNYKVIDISAFYSTVFVEPYILSSGSNTNLYFYLDRDNPVLYQGENRAVVYMDVYTDSSTAPVLNATSITGTGWSSYTDNLSEDSADLASQSNQAHQQEQAFFNQNSQAIANTGLSNYQFSTDNGNGVASVSVDFTNLWNALGGWTSVYIFSMTLGLALSIIKHSPNAINRRIRNKSSE